MPRVSVLLTCFNHAKFLPEAWTSIQRQTYRDFEVIVIDDGSTDGTRDWLSSIEGEVNLVLNEKNLGTYGSLNKGLRLASGEFVAILNDDDLWQPTKLERQVQLFDELPELGLVHTHGTFIDGEGRQVSGAPLGFEYPKTHTGDIALDLVFANRIIASSVLFNRELVERLGGFDDELFGSGDWNMWIRLALQAHVGYVDEFLTKYRIHDANASYRFERVWQDDVAVRTWIRSHKEEFESHSETQDRWVEAMSHNEACLGTALKLLGKASEARQAYWRSIQMDPRRWKSYVRFMATFLPVGQFRKLN
ncbi:MAG TPA: glycosyltransferase [Fimbriimonadaceae bacterium]|nr:glycosyltransferase [Fimbriimonadaceae bacterium]